MFHLKRFALIILGQLSSMVSSEFSNLPAISHKSHDFVVVIIFITIFLNCCQISSVLHNIPAQPRVGRLRRSCFRGDALGDFTPSP